MSDTRPMRPSTASLAERALKAMMARHGQVELPVLTVEVTVSDLHKLQPVAEPLDLAGHQPLRLKSWPEMRKVPVERLLDTARVCALLSRRPTVAYLVPSLLDLSKEALEPVLADLQAQGCLWGSEVVRTTLPGAVNEAALRPEPPAPEAPTAVDNAAALQKRSLWAKLLHKLLH